MDGWFVGWLLSEMKRTRTGTTALCALLQAKGVEVSGTTVRNWKAAANLPSPAHMHALLDVFHADNERRREEVAAAYLAERADRARRAAEVA